MKRKNISQAYLRLQALHLISQEFAEAMAKADMGYIACRNNFTPAMGDIWSRYVELARTYGKDA